MRLGKRESNALREIRVSPIGQRTEEDEVDPILIENELTADLATAGPPPSTKPFLISHGRARGRGLGRE